MVAGCSSVLARLRIASHGYFSGLLGIVLLLSMLSAAPAWAQEVETQVDRNTVELGEAVDVQIQVTGGTPRPVDMQRLSDWRVDYTGQETSFTAVNLNFTRTTVFHFRFTPLREGTLTIPPVRVEVDGRQLQTQPVQVRVVRGGGNALGAVPDGGDVHADGSEDVFVQVELEPRQAYVGQPVAQTLKIFTAVPTGDSTQVERQPIPGTIGEQLADNEAQRRYIATVNGRRYKVEEVTWVFYPVTSGTLDIPPMQITVPVIDQLSRRGRRSSNPLFDDFFGPMRTVTPRTFSTEEQTIDVRPLPKDERPAGFTGLVGRFTVKADVSARSLALGDSSTMTIEVEGQGNVRDLTLPDLNAAEFKVYDDAPTVETSLGQDGTLVSRKSFKRAVVPQRSGELTVPPVTISYFNPATRQYEQASTPSFTLSVAPGAGGQTTLAGPQVVQAPGKQTIQVTGEDILPIHTGPMLVMNRYIPLASAAALGWLLFPVALFGIAGTFRRVRDTRNADPVKNRRRQALRNAQAVLKEIEGESSAADERHQLDRLSRLFRSYLGDKLSLEGAALTAQEARRQLVTAGVPDPIAAEAEQFIEQIEQARYAPGGTTRSLQGLKTRAKVLLDKLEKALG